MSAGPGEPGWRIMVDRRGLAARLAGRWLAE
eukprot:CAMPEP_0116823260 /NCGR_PEP_ID=MMETSP0418-20121206/741_1 /TAXON_ID=1158023 /ORGANISM="Astrosyne radiata, Strain 13vi08-1A" /LENGTH=30 /DNA_ID= /DNA_START= /DNA_END= /DNA_ORIENTATION=